MKQFFSKFGIWLLGALAVITVVLCILSSIGSGTGILRNIGGILASPFRSVGSAVSSWAQNITDHFDDVETLQAENEALRQENAQLQKELRQAQEDSEENRSLRQAIGLRQQHRDYTLENARITDRSDSNWTSTLTLSCGTNCGIAVGNCAVDAYGNLVGVITDAGTNWSTVTTILDTGSEIGARVFRTNDVAVTAGDLALYSQNCLKLRYLASDAQLISGDLVVTSGLGGYYPSDLPIGSVTELGVDETGVAQYAVLSPKADIAHLSELFVITAFDVTE